MDTREQWKVREVDFPTDKSLNERLRFLLNYAVLAPSSHNSQPWIFTVGNDFVELEADESRWLRVADTDKRELYLSLGSALENLLVAAEHFDLEGSVAYFPEPEKRPDLAAKIVFTALSRASEYRPAELFDAITARHTNHRPYDGRPILDNDLTRLSQLVAEPGIGLHFAADPNVVRRVDELTTRADALQFADPEWRRELGKWIGEGAFGDNWVVSKLSKLAVSYLNLSGTAAKKDSELLHGISMLGTVTAGSDDPVSRVKAGQVFERIFLKATALGIRLQPMNQVLQIPEIKEEFAGILPPDWGEPQITFRMGYAEKEEHTPRRPVDEVVREAAGDIQN